MKFFFLICLTFLISCVNSNENKMPVVELDIQSWQANNLDVVTFRNGDSIKQALNSQDWINAGIKKEPCWAYYGFSKEKKGDESKYYNWYAVNDPRKLAPQGFIIPSVSDVDHLISFLGKEDAGRKLKNWDTTGFVKTDFNISASGFINSKGISISKGYCATFWTTDTTGGNYSKIWYVTSNSDQLLYHSFNKATGHVVRCFASKFGYGRNGRK
jgi:uncharacterized protein (TIGR02145 family)